MIGLAVDTGQTDDPTLVSDIGTPRAPEPAAPRSIARYRVLERLGSGSMGVVYAAYDDELGRKVAIKLLHPGSAAHRRERLAAEARALARLSDPNVVKVFEVGTVDAPDPKDRDVYIVMEHVDGVPLSEWMRARERPWREVVEVLARAAQGLSAAHRAGLVHGDFKPANVLVEHGGRVIVIDFGLAHAGAPGPESGALSEQPHDPIRTRPEGRVVGTPAYMAPELQDGGDPEPAADQFAFCVSAWECLYGERPFEGETPAAVAASITHGRIVVPRKASRVPGWLCEAVLRGLSTRPEQRWPSMEELVEAMTRARRRTAWIAGTAALVLTAGVTLAVARPRAPAAGCDAEVDRLAPVWGSARAEAVRELLEPVGKDASARLLAEIEAWAARWHVADVELCTAERDPGEIDRGRACLVERRRSFGALVDGFAEPDLRKVDDWVEGVRALGRPEDCASPRLAGVAPPSDPATAAAVEAARERLARISARRWHGSVGDVVDAIAIEVEAARATGYGPLVAETLVLRSDFLNDVARSDEALADAAEAFSLATAAGDDAMALRAGQCAMWALYLRGRYDEALDWARTTEAVIVRAGAPEAERAHLLLELGPIEIARGDPAAAVELLTDAVEIFERVEGPTSYNLGAALNNLGVAYSVLSRWEEAEAAHRRALAIREATVGPNHPHIAMSAGNLAAVLVPRDRLDEAEVHLRRALQVSESALGPDHEDTVRATANLGFLLHLRGRSAEALPIIERSIAATRRAKGEHDPLVAVGSHMLAEVYRALDRWEDAVLALHAAIAIVEPTQGRVEPSPFELNVELGQALAKLGRREQAVAAFEKALPQAERAAATAAEVAAARFELAKVLPMQRRVEALTHARAARDVLVKDPEQKTALGEVEAWLKKQR
jgi:tetratricopeptide (TPR) repeat protein/predicted Ser/Thr protein kinase